MSIKQLLADGRKLAGTLMEDTGEALRPSGEPDELTGLPALVQVWSGRLKVQTYEAQEANPTTAGSVWTVQRYAVHIPVGAYEPQLGDVIHITWAAARDEDHVLIEGVNDPYLTGRKFRVVALLHKTWATAYRLGVEDFGDEEDAP